MGLKEAQRDQLVPERLVAGDLGGGIPAFELEGKVKPGPRSAPEPCTLQGLEPTIGLAALLPRS